MSSYILLKDMKAILSTICILLFCFSCSNKGWTEGARLELISECEMNSQHSICVCVIDRFIEDFTFEEYIKMTQESITNQSNPEMYSKLNVYIDITLEKCNISF